MEKFNGKIIEADVEAAKALLASGEYEKWEKVGEVKVEGHPVTIRRQALDNGLYQYYATGTLPLHGAELAEINWDCEYRQVIYSIH
jgi:hypothetical protein